MSRPTIRWIPGTPITPNVYYDEEMAGVTAANWASIVPRGMKLSDRVTAYLYALDLPPSVYREFQLDYTLAGDVKKTRDHVGKPGLERNGKVQQVKNHVFYGGGADAVDPGKIGTYVLYKPTSKLGSQQMQRTLNAGVSLEMLQPKTRSNASYLCTQSNHRAKNNKVQAPARSPQGKQQHSTRRRKKNSFHQPPPVHDDYNSHIRKVLDFWGVQDRSNTDRLDSIAFEEDFLPEGARDRLKAYDEGLFKEADLAHDDADLPEPKRQRGNR